MILHGCGVKLFSQNPTISEVKRNIAEKIYKQFVMVPVDISWKSIQCHAFTDNALQLLHICKTNTTTRKT